MFLYEGSHGTSRGDHLPQAQGQACATQRWLGTMAGIPSTNFPRRIHRGPGQAYSLPKLEPRAIAVLFRRRAYTTQVRSPGGPTIHTLQSVRGRPRLIGVLTRTDSDDAWRVLRPPDCCPERLARCRRGDEGKHGRSDAKVCTRIGMSLNAGQHASKSTGAKVYLNCSEHRLAVESLLICGRPRSI